MLVSPANGLEVFTCPYCGGFLSIQKYIDLVSDNVCCKRCHQFVNIPALISLETDDKPFHPGQLCRESYIKPNGRLYSRKVPVTAQSRQLDLFGGAL